MRHQRPNARLLPMRDGSIAFFSSYNPGLVIALKAQIPSTERKWDPDEKCWRVAARHAQTCADIALQRLGITVQIPAIVATSQTATTQLLRLEYLGAARDRGGGEPTAYGWANNGWNVIFPLSVLRNWFEVGNDEQKPDAAITLYGVLGVGRKAGKDEVKAAYRRAARTWHPDVCPDPEAADQFRRVQFAYETLSTPTRRGKYDAGLALTASLKHDQLPSAHKFAAHYRTPIRCGYVLAEGIEQLGRFVVSRILQWSDVVNQQGQILVTYWRRGEDTFDRKWVQP